MHEVVFDWSNNYKLNQFWMEETGYTKNFIQIYSAPQTIKKWCCDNNIELIYTYDFSIIKYSDADPNSNDPCDYFTEVVSITFYFENKNDAIKFKLRWNINSNE